MKTLYLLRHAKSDWGNDGIEDHARPLAPRGVRACAKLGELLPTLDPPELAWCSSATRTQETFAHTRDHWQAPPRLEVDGALYLAGPGEILRVLSGTDPAIERVLVVAHHPGLQLLTLGLTRAGVGDTRERAKQKFPTAALATLELSAPDWKLVAESGTLRQFVTPRELP